MKKIVTIILVLLSIGGMVWCFGYFSKGNLTINEQVLFGIFLSLASFFFSWALSHFYYEMSHQESVTQIKKDYQSSLKVYASKAAEKVTNLSTEFTKLGNYLKEEFDDVEYESEQENLNAKKERIYSAIHIINTLKSINDGSLSDWKGIIPDEEIAEIAEEEREKIENFDSILKRYQSVIKSSEEEVDYTFKDEDLKEEINQLNRRLEVMSNNVLGVVTKDKNNLVKKEKIAKQCPNCSVLTEYKQKPLLSSRKWIKCKNCGTKLACRWSVDGGFTLEVFNENTHEQKVNNESPLASEFQQGEDFVERVRGRLPVQPWPKKIGDTVAKELGVSSKDVHRAITILIDRGVFKHQVNGVLYIKDPTQEPSV